MADRSDVFNRSSNLNRGKDNRNNNDYYNNKRPNASGDRRGGGGDRDGPNSKRPRNNSYNSPRSPRREDRRGGGDGNNNSGTTNGIQITHSQYSQDFDKLILKVVNNFKDNADDRRKELKAFATCCVSRLGMNDLNYYLQSIKRSVESKKMTTSSSTANNNSTNKANGEKKSTDNSTKDNSTQNNNNNDQTSGNDSKGPPGGSNNNTTNNKGADSKTDDQKSPDETSAGSADGKKPTMSGSFYPLQQAGDVLDEKNRKEAEKTFTRKNFGENRTAEEEEEYQNLLHSIAENPVVNQDTNEFDEERFDQILTDSIKLGRKLKDYFQVWSHCQIKTSGPMNVLAGKTLFKKICNSTALNPDSSNGIGHFDEESIADILGWLVKEKEISPKSLEDILKEVSGIAPPKKTADSSGDDDDDDEVPQESDDDVRTKLEQSDADLNGKSFSKILGYLLVFLFPSAKNDFGWNRVGWGYTQFYVSLKKILKILDDRDVKKRMIKLSDGETTTTTTTTEEGMPSSSALCALKLFVEKVLEYTGGNNSSNGNGLSKDKQEKLILRAMECDSDKEDVENPGSKLKITRAEAVEILGISGDSTFKPSPSPTSEE